MRLRAACVAALAAVLSTGATAQQATESATGAVLRGLDKFSGKVVDIQMKAGGTVRFERLNITLVECRFPSGNPAGNAYAGLQITETGRDGVVFSGCLPDQAGNKPTQPDVAPADPVERNDAVENNEGDNGDHERHER